ncbi:MAG: hypothetical protein QOD93_887 [Acetobacteraceae bacterium]|nr:hypothetical protein [Acetobacteraceae bacterium]
MYAAPSGRAPRACVGIPANAHAKAATSHAPVREPPRRLCCMDTPWLQDTSSIGRRAATWPRPSLGGRGASALRDLVWVTASANRPRSIPDFNFLVVAGLMRGYLDSLFVCRTLNVLAFDEVPLLVQPNKSVCGHLRLLRSSHRSQPPFLRHDVRVIPEHSPKASSPYPAGVTTPREGVVARIHRTSLAGKVIHSADMALPGRPALAGILCYPSHG